MILAIGFLQNQHVLVEYHARTLNLEFGFTTLQREIGGREDFEKAEYLLLHLPMEGLENEYVKDVLRRRGRRKIYLVGSIWPDDRTLLNCEMRHFESIPKAFRAIKHQMHPAK